MGQRKYRRDSYTAFPQKADDVIEVELELDELDVTSAESTMIDKCLELIAYDAQYRIQWIVFDRDQVQGFDEIIKEAEDKGMQVGWSNPYFEIWMYAYFDSMPAIQDSWTCCSEFGWVYEAKTGQKYYKPGKSKGCADLRQKWLCVSFSAEDTCGK